jgi:hypothetical protein
LLQQTNYLCEYINVMPLLPGDSTTVRRVTDVPTTEAINNFAVSSPEAINNFASPEAIPSFFNGPIHHGTIPTTTSGCQTVSQEAPARPSTLPPLPGWLISTDLPNDLPRPLFPP